MGKAAHWKILLSDMVMFSCLFAAYDQHTECQGHLVVGVMCKKKTTCTPI